MPLSAKPGNRPSELAALMDFMNAAMGLVGGSLVLYNRAIRSLWYPALPRGDEGRNLGEGEEKSNASEEGGGDEDVDEVDNSFLCKLRFELCRSRLRFDGKHALQPSTVHLCISLR